MNDVTTGYSNVLNPITGEYEKAFCNKEDGKNYRKLQMDDAGYYHYSDPMPDVPTAKNQGKQAKPKN